MGILEICAPAQRASLRGIRGRQIKPRVAALLSIVVLAACSTAFAQTGGKYPFEEYDKLINQRRTVTTLGPDLFGDSVDLYSGALSFSATDITIPGNNALPVAVTRKLEVINRKDYPIKDALFADWDIDLPNLSGVFATTWHDNRCAVTTVEAARPPEATVRGYPIQSMFYWKGNTADMPGGGDMMLISTDASRPSTGGPYHWITPGRTVFSCLAQMSGGAPGQGFLAITADGVKYRFDHMAQYHEPRYEEAVHGGPAESGHMSFYSLIRKRNVLYPTQIEDRFGNKVTYTYSNAYNQRLKIDSIASSDARTITLHYNAYGYVDSISDGARTWRYEYDYSAGTNKASLRSVVLPDTRRWTMGLSALSKAELRYQESWGPGEVWRNCEHRLGNQLTGDIVGTITHPSGATGSFTVAPAVHGRTNVPLICRNYIPPQDDPRLDDYNNPNDDVAVLPFKWHALSLKRKEITGVALPAQIWTFEYSPSSSFYYPNNERVPLCWEVDCMVPRCQDENCARSKNAVVVAPGGKWKRYTFGNSYRYNEGKLLRVEEGSNQDAILKTTDTAYEFTFSGRPYPTRLGISPQPYGDGFISEYPRPQVAKIVTQQGTTFSWAVDTGCASAYCFDSLMRPTRVKRFSSLGFAKTDTTTYHDNLGKWVLGQAATQSTDGIQTAKTDYDANAMPWKTWTFGKLQQTLTYELTTGDQDGTLKTVTDGGNHTTTLSEWYRGVPRKIQHPVTPESPGGATESAVVTANGWIKEAVDENGHRSCFTHDPMGRLRSLTHPSETQVGTCDTSKWNATSQIFLPSLSAKYGLPVGHWQQTIETGAARRITYFDALWRPVIEEAFDNDNEAATRSIVVKRYDAAGRPSFESYPIRALSNYAAVTAGTHTLYDTLDRPELMRQTSELGNLDTVIAYLPGFLRRTTNPRGIATTESFQAFDAPTDAAPLQIDAAENTSEHARTLITRDVFGLPTEISRGPGS